MALGALTPSEARWIDYVQNNVVGKLQGDRARTAAIVTWWALKEGIFDLANPLRHNLCTFPDGSGDQQIGDLATCAGPAWQVGLSGIQPGNVSLTQTQAVAASLYPGQSIPSILERTAIAAGVDGASVDQIKNSTGDLQKSWLLRDPGIGFTLQRPFVESGCLTGQASWCLGSWDSAKRFASSAARIKEVVADLQAQFANASGPGSNFPALLAVGAAAGLAYWLWRSGRLPSIERSRAMRARKLRRRYA